MDEKIVNIVNYVEKWASMIRATINSPDGRSNISRDLMYVDLAETAVAEGLDPSLAGVTREEMQSWRKGLYRAKIRWAEKNNMVGEIVDSLKEGGFKSPEEAGVTDAKVLVECHKYFR